MAKLSLEEKRLQTLRRQLFGKDTTTPILEETDKRVNSKTSEVHLSTNGPTTQSQKVEVNFLRRDLIRIAFLTAVFISIQLSLFFASQNGLIHLGF